MIWRLLLFTLAMVMVEMTLVPPAEAKDLQMTIEQITSGPQHHFFGYIGQSRTIPWNASGRYIVGMRTNFHDHMPTSEDAADIILIDTKKDNQIIAVDQTRAWNFQQGTMLYWNPEQAETQFFFNDRDPKDNKIFTVLYDIRERKRIREYRYPDTPVGNSGVAQGGKYFLALNYGRMAQLRPVTGYPGTFDWTVGQGAPENDGIFIVDINSGEKRLLVSFSRLALTIRSQYFIQGRSGRLHAISPQDPGAKANAIQPDISQASLYINHTLWNRQDDRIYFYLRGRHDNQSIWLDVPFTIKPDGTGLTMQPIIIGGHPEWGEGSLIIGDKDNLQALYDVDKKRIVGQLGTEKIFPKPGGDIALSPDGNWFVNGYSSDHRKNNNYIVLRRTDGAFIRSPAFDRGPYTRGDLRIDPAPRWNRSNDAVLVPGWTEGGNRQLFVIRIHESPLQAGQPIPFASHGTLKMFYDSRMHPQAVEYQGKVYIVWRGEKGMPFITSYDLGSRTFSQPVMVLSGLEDQIDRNRYERDHHFSPVLWIDQKGYFHILTGCHGNQPAQYTSGDHFISARPGDLSRWAYFFTRIHRSVNYPKVFPVYDDKIVIYFRDGGHLGAWTYRISSDGGRNWTGPVVPPLDLDANPQDGFMADQAGSYHTARVSKDGKKLHVAFVWNDTDYDKKNKKQPPNPRYRKPLGRDSRYNLYYLKIDLVSEKIYSIQDKELQPPVRKAIADRKCLVWDTDMRVAAIPPSIWLDENDQPSFILPVSEETPYRSWFYFIKRQEDGWIKTPITRTSNPFNSCHLVKTNGVFRAYLVTGEGESISDSEMNRYGWGDAVEEWISNDEGQSWHQVRDLTPATDLRYQNIQFVTTGAGSINPHIVLFYGWKADGPGTAFLLDERND